MYYKINFVLFWFFLTSSVEGMSHEIDRSFKLIFWGAELGEFEVKGEIESRKYSVTTRIVGKSLISLFSKYEISSGAVGDVNGNGEFIPRESVTRWNTRGKFRQTQLFYKNGALTDFQTSLGLSKEYHIDNPIGIGNTIDPVSLVYWLLLERGEHQLCKQKLVVLDGFRMSELSFKTKNRVENSFVCTGEIYRIEGFKNLDLNKKPLGFEIIYNLKNENKFAISQFEIETIFGKIILK